MKKILVIDDEPSVREAFALALADYGCELLAAANGSEGLRAASVHQPGLVFLDLRMPGMDGVEVLRRLQPQLPAARIYIATAYRRDFLEPLRAAAADGYRFEVMEKPLDREQIRAIVDTAYGAQKVL